MKITFLTIGDPHFRSHLFYLSRVIEMGEKVVELCKERKPDFIVNMGDTLHDHSKIDMVAQNKAVDFMRKLKDIAPLYTLIGNHDMINAAEFLTGISPFNAMKEWKNTVIVDDRVEKVEINGFKFFFVPYVPPKRFKEALDMFDVNPNDYLCGFAHQTFQGCKTSLMSKTEFDEWIWDTPIIAGHEHEKEKFGMVNYVGTPIGHSHGEHGKKTISFFTVSDVEIPELINHFWCKSQGFFIYEEEIELGVKKLRTIHIDAKDFLKHSFDEGEDPRYYKFCITGKDVDLKKAKKSDKYHEYENLGCKIHFPLIKEKDEGEKLEKRNYNGISFTETVHEKLKEHDEELFHLYEEIMRN